MTGRRLIHLTPSAMREPAPPLRRGGSIARLTELEDLPALDGAVLERRSREFRPPNVEKHAVWQSLISTYGNVRDRA